MDNEVKNALMAFANRKKRVDIPQLKGVDVYIRPIPYEMLFKLMADAEGETKEERDINGDHALCAYSMVDSNDNPVFTPTEYAKWIGKVDFNTALLIVKTRNELNDFSGLDADSKKK